MSRTLAVHVRYKSLYISRPSTAEQKREMTKFCALWRTWASTAVISYFVLEFSLGAHISVWVSPSDTVRCAEKVQVVAKVNCNSLKSSTSLKVPNYTGPDLISCFILQFPCAFEFNEQFLITVLDHLTRYDKEYCWNCTQSISTTNNFESNEIKSKFKLKTDFFPVRCMFRREYQ